MSIVCCASLLSLRFCCRLRRLMSSFGTQFDEAEYRPIVHLATVYSRCSVLTNFWLVVSAVQMSVILVGGSR